MLENFTRDTFLRHLDSKFRVGSGAPGAVELQLIEAEDHTRSPKNERFSLLFRGPKDSPLAQGMHRFEHDEIGSFDLFIVPVSQDQEGTQYEAIFNRLRR